MKIFNLPPARKSISDYDNPYVPNQIEALYNQSLREGEKTIEAYARLEAQLEEAEESAARTREELGSETAPELEPDLEQALQTVKEVRRWISEDHMLIWKCGPQEILQVLGQNTVLRPDFTTGTGESLERYMKNCSESYKMLGELSHFESGHMATRDELLDAAWVAAKDGKITEPAPGEHLYSYIRQQMKNAGDKLSTAQLVLEESDPHRRYLEELES